MDHHSTKRAARLEVFLELIGGGCRRRLLGAWTRQDAGACVRPVEVLAHLLRYANLRCELGVERNCGHKTSLLGRATGHFLCTLLDPCGPVVYLRAARCLVLASGTCRAG